MTMCSLDKSMNINIIPSSGLIQLASSSHSLPRVGVTPPLTFTPVAVQGTLQQLKPHTHSFEVMTLSTHKYQFILGMDLLRQFFPSQIPTSLLLDDRTMSSAATSMTGPTSSLIHTPIPRAALSDAVSAQLQHTIDDLAGQGYTPSDEESVRVELEEAYAE